MYKRRRKKKGGSISRNFKNSEILFKDELGIHLKPGVHRLHYNTHQDIEELESHFNEHERRFTNYLKKIKQSMEVDNHESDI